MGWIYAIECIPTKEFYIGSTRLPIATRFRAHHTAFRRGRNSPALQAAYDEYGLDNLRFTQLREFPDTELARREGEAIDAVKPALNINTRAPQVDQIGVKRSGARTTTIQARARRGLTGDALYAPPYANKKRYEVRGEKLTANEIAEKYDLNLATVRARASSGYVGDEIIRGSRLL